MMEYGEVAVRREVWHGSPWSALATTVIEDSSELLALHLAVGSPMAFVDDHPLGVHTWAVNNTWQGLDIVMLQRPLDSYSVWFFGEFAVYVNLQDPYRRTELGFDTFDHELDVVVSPDGSWVFKDEDRMPMTIESGRFTTAEVETIHATGAAIGEMLDAGEAWWSPDWATWTPPEHWPTPTLPANWATV